MQSSPSIQPCGAKPPTKKANLAIPTPTHQPTSRGPISPAYSLSYFQAATNSNGTGTAIIPDLSALNGNGGISSAIGSNRTPTTWNLDLGFYYPIKFSESKELRFTADWFNVTNSQRAVTLDQTFLINSGVTGVAPVSNPFYGSGLIFQYPSALRLGAKFSF